VSAAPGDSVLKESPLADAYLEDLSPEQRAAVTHQGGPLLVLAGAGSGKTRVITRRVCWLVQSCGAESQHVLAVTFTNKAAREMRERLEPVLGHAGGGLFVGTFHAWGLRLLRRHGSLVGLPREFQVLDRSDQLALVRAVAEELGLDTTQHTPRRLLTRLSRLKNGMGGRLDDVVTQQALESYSAGLERAGALDFDDLLLKPLALLREHPQLRHSLDYRHVLVDEYQDTNRAQGELVEALMPQQRDLLAVGDEDQSIYAFRGARVDNILEFQQRFTDATVLRLERNYRSTGHIVGAASGLIASNRHRLGKRLFADGELGGPVELHGAATATGEAELLARLLQQELNRSAARELAVLYRTNAQSRLIEEALVRARIPYVIVKGLRFYERREVKDVLAYVRLVLTPDANLALRRVLNVPPRGIGPATLAALEEAASGAGVSLWQALESGLVKGAAAARLEDFQALVMRIRAGVAELPTAEAVRELVRFSGYESYLRQGAGRDDDAPLEHVDELVEKARSLGGVGAQGLSELLDEAALTSEADELQGGAVSLMTLHNAKGLEFDTVMIAGVETGLLPHPGLGGQVLTERDLEEERRLLYVGMTRARRRLVLSYAYSRSWQGREREAGPSSFLDEIPDSHLRRLEPAPPLSYRSTYHRNRSGPDPGSTIATTGSGAGTGGYRKGSRVRHPRYGTGTVIGLEGTGDDLKLTVYFERHGRKKLVARYAGLMLQGRG
jgi:DNA helicase-2/ATP-dependent DNA helicase PcrA